jgi:hypothetical protein
VAGHIADNQPDPATRDWERVVPVAADGGSLGTGQEPHREVQPGDSGRASGSRERCSV